MITRMDRDIGPLADLLRARGIDRQTLVMFVSDNGPHQEGGGDPVFFKSSGGLRGIKRDLYEGGIRVPMIARWTGTIPAGRVSDHVWAHWDMLPTLTESRAPRSPGGTRRPVDGARAARRAAADARFPVLGISRARLPAGRADGTWKAVRLKKDAPLELYDLATDPAEQRDVAAAHPQVVAQDRGVSEEPRVPDSALAGQVMPTETRLLIGAASLATAALSGPRARRKKRCCPGTAATSFTCCPRQPEISD